MRAERRKGKNRRRWLPRIIYMLFLIATIVYVSNRGGAFSYALFYATVIYPPLAWLYLLYVRAKIRVSQELPYREVRKGTEETYQLTIENSGWLPVSGIRLFHRTGTVLREDMAGEVLSRRRKRSSPPGCPSPMREVMRRGWTGSPSGTASG